MAKCFKSAGVVVTLGICMLVQGCTVIGNPYKDAAAMRQELLKFTPLGSTMAEVETKLKKKHVAYDKNLRHGFVRRRDRQMIGAKCLEVDFGGYRSALFSTTGITSFWGFDADDKLVDVWVWKAVDSL